MATYKPLITERVVDTAKQEPKGPQILKAEICEVVGGQDQQPYQHKFDVHHTTVKGKLP